jgi:hypothetical protein
MTEDLARPRSSTFWNAFTIVSFAIAAAMMAGGIYHLDASFAAKGFYAMAALMLVHTTVSITNALRDAEDARRLHNRLDEARTERLLMEVAGPKAA